MNDFLDLLGNLWSFMLVVTLLAVAAGWSWAEMQARPKWRILEDERRYLRNELFGAAGSFKVDPAEVGVPRSKRIADLEQALAEARGRGMEVEVLRLRIAELERGAGTTQPRSVAAFDITDYSEKISALEEENAHLRAGRLTPDEQAEVDAERNRVFQLEQELEEARDKAAAAEALEARVKQLESAPPPVSQDDLTVLTWRNRYLGERVKYLETQEPPQALVAPPPAPAPVVAAATEPSPEEQAAAKEKADRLAWRMRYLEQRALYLESTPQGEDAAPFKAKIGDLEAQLGAALARAPVLEGQIAPLKARIAELEGNLPGLHEQVAAAQAHELRADELQKRLTDAEANTAQIHADLEHDMVRAKWKSRYLEARVRYLEGRPAAAPAPVVAPSVAPVMAEPPRVERPAPAPVAPAAPVEMFRMERPAALSAPRNGAADDLRLILGVSGQVQSSLNAIGIFHFEQLAAWRPAHVAWVDQYLNLRGRIGAERWVEQSQALARGVALNLEHQVS